MIYLDNARTSHPKEPAVLAAMNAAAMAPPPPEPCAPRADPGGGPRWLRALLAELTGAESCDCIALTAGATTALNLAIEGLVHHQGGHVVTTRTEHNSVLRPLFRLKNEGRIDLTVTPTAGGAVRVDEIAAALRPDTVLVAVNHVSHVTGQIVPVAHIGTLCRERGIALLVDAAQSLGAWPVDVRRDGIDLLAFTGHKALGGLPGVGGLYIRPGLHLRPLIAGAAGTRDDLVSQPTAMPHYYEAGSENVPGRAALAAGTARVLEIGVPSIASRLERMTGELCDFLSAMDEVRLHGAGTANAQGPVVSFTLNGRMPAQVGARLEEEFGIRVGAGLHCAPLIHETLGTVPSGTLRVSLSRTTRAGELLTLRDALRSLCRARSVYTVASAQV